MPKEGGAEMSEEKRLDEKALEEVSGGVDKSKYDSFQFINCHKCSHYIKHTCPYGSIADALADAIKVFGKSKCPKRVSL